MDPLEFQLFGLAISGSAGPPEGMDVTVKAIQRAAPSTVPDVGRARQALDAWGIPYTEGPPITQLVSATKTLAATLPPGWSVSGRGGGGHRELLDANGASRIRWYIHGWDPISLDINERFSIRGAKDLSPTEAVIHIMDGDTVIFAITVKYPHARINDPDRDGTPFYRNGNTDEGWTNDMGDANYKARRDAREAASEWLDTNRPGHRDAMLSWTL